MPTTVCPDDAVLESLLLGRLDDALAPALEEHLAGCRSCGARAEALRVEDGLVLALRGNSLLTGEGSRDDETLVERTRSRLAAALPGLAAAGGPAGYEIVRVLG